MIYGIPTLMEFSDAETLARFCAETGYGFVEMNMTFPWFQRGACDAEALKALKRKYGIGFTIHLHDGVNPFEFSPEMRRGSLDNVCFAMELARALEVRTLTMHLQPGTYSAVNGVKTYLYERCREKYLELAESFVTLVEAGLKGTGAVLCVENTAGFRPFQQEAVDLMLRSPCFGLTFDIGHSFKAGGEDERFILARSGRLRHFHIHDCSMKANHLAFGEGGLDLPRYLKMAADLGCTAVAEVKESGALIRSREYLLDLGMWDAEA